MNTFQTIWAPIIAGLATGFLIGLTGMGGGALMTPFLILWLKMDPVQAVGTDLLFAAITKTVGGVQHHRKSQIDLKQLFWMSSGSLPAAFFGAQFILRQRQNLPLIEDLLPTILGAVLLLVGLITLYRSLSFSNKTEPFTEKWPTPFSLIRIGAVGGLLVGTTSVGGGTVIMALLLLFYTFPLPYMVGLDVMHGAILTSVAALIYVVDGQSEWQLIGLLLIGSFPGVWLGSRLIHHINLRLVHLVLALLILAAGIEFLF